MKARSLLTVLVSWAAWGAMHARGDVTVLAEREVGISFIKDVQAAMANPAIAANPLLKQAVMTGDDLLKGNRILVGHFDLTDAQIRAKSTDVGFLFSNFNLYGSGQVGALYNIDGHYSFTLDGDADGKGLVNKQIYLFFLGATDNTSLASSVASAFQLGIFYLDSATWRFPSETAIPATTAVDLRDMTQQTSSNGPLELKSPDLAHVVVGSFGGDTSNATGGRNFQLAAVPEPTSASLGLAGLGALLGARWRRRVK